MQFPAFYGTEMFITEVTSPRHPVTRVRRVLRSRMEERPPMWRVAANILNKQSRTADNVCTANLAAGRGSNNSSK